MTRRGLAVLGLVLAVAAGRADDAKTVQEAEKVLGELKTVLTGIKTAAGAKAALPRLKRLDERLEKVHLAFQKNGGNKADVWSLGHPLEKKPIGNWRAPKEGKEKEKKEKNG